MIPVGVRFIYSFKFQTNGFTCHNMSEHGAYHTSVIIFTKEDGKDIGISSSILFFPSFNLQSVCG